MATIRAIKKRIKSAKNISQITKAMQMVAAAKMKKAQDQAEQGKPYSEKIHEAVSELSHGVDHRLHRLLGTGNPDGHTLVVLIATNKGLCGGLNTTLFRNTLKWFTDNQKAEFITLGKKGQRYIVHSKWNLSADFSDEHHMINAVPAVTQLFTEGFLSGLYKDVYLVYNRFVNSLTQEPVLIQVLPLAIPGAFEKEDTTKKEWNEFIIEPSAKQVLEKLLPHYIETQIRSAILEAEASEHSARMVAMKNATDNAKDLIDDLTFGYNRLRQEKITSEIADIVTARESMR